MGCVVNGPGESKHADIGISLPGTFEEPVAPVFVDGQLDRTLRGEGLVAEFIGLLEEYVERRYGGGRAGSESSGPDAAPRRPPADGRRRVRRTTRRAGRGHCRAITTGPRWRPRLARATVKGTVAT